MDKLDTLPFAEYKDRLFERLGRITEYSALTAEEQAQYDADVKWASDYNETVLFRYDQGLKEGEARGRAEGRAEEAIAIARNLLMNGMDAEFISKVTGLSLEIIEQLKRS